MHPDQHPSPADTVDSYLFWEGLVEAFGMDDGETLTRYESGIGAHVVGAHADEADSDFGDDFGWLAG